MQIDCSRINTDVKRMEKEATKKLDVFLFMETSTENNFDY